MNIVLNFKRYKTALLSEQYIFSQNKILLKLYFLQYLSVISFLIIYSNFKLEINSIKTLVFIMTNILQACLQFVICAFFWGGVFPVVPLFQLIGKKAMKF